MEGIRFKESLIAIILMPFVFAACESDSYDHDIACPEVRVFFAPSRTHQNITRVMVIVSAPDMDTIKEALSIVGDKASGTLEVPVGRSRRFLVEAYEGSLLRHRGDKTVDIPAGDPISLNIYLEPTTLALIIQAASKSVSVGDRFTVEAKVSNVNDLYAVTFALRYDANLLSVVEQEITPGSFLGTDALFFKKVENDTISIGITLKGNMNGVNGSGTVATIPFQALTKGTARIELLQDQRLSLTKPDGNSVAGFADVIIIAESIIIEK